MSDTILNIFGIVGIGGILTATITYLWDKKKSINIKWFELKEKRYANILLKMISLVMPSAQKYIIFSINTDMDKSALQQDLTTEWINMLLFSDIKTIKSLKKFIKTPSKDNLLATISAMRKELWNSKLEKLNSGIFFELDEFISKN